MGNSSSGVTSTRIDRWYVPIDTDYLLTFSVENDYIFKEHSSDHRAVTLTIDNKLGTRGKDRDSIDEALMEREDIQNKIKDIVEEMIVESQMMEIDDEIKQLLEGGK